MHPVLQVVFFFSILLTGMAVAMGIGMFILAGFGGESVESVLEWAGRPGSPRGRQINLWLNSLNQIVAFGGGAILFHFLFGGRLKDVLIPIKTKPNPSLLSWLAMASVLALAMAPVLDLTYRLNRLMVEWIPMIGEMVAFYEDAAEVVTRALLTMPDLGSFIGILVAIAVLPAIFEEIAFRGVLMPRLARATGNIHAAVWISAALFSAIHLQFFGFIPRMLIGAGLGYLVIHSGRLWPAMVAHFVNNGMAVVSAYIMGPEWLETGLDPMSPWELADYGFAVGAVAVLGAGWGWFHRQPTSWEESKAAYLDDGEARFAR